MIEKYGIKFHSDFKLLHKNFGAITLFGHVYTRKTKEELEKWLESYSGKVMTNHERIHMLQAKSFKTRYFGFYIYYLMYWIKNLYKYGFNMKAYYNIPFELEAYDNEFDFRYTETHWKDYINEF